MQNFIEFFSSLEIKDYIEILLRLVFAVLVFIRTGKKGVIKEMFKYRTEQDAQKESAECKGQSFSNKRQVYHLNTVTDKLEAKKGDEIDLQEMVNSAVDVALDRVMSKFLDTQAPVTDMQDKVADYTSLKSDLDFMSDAFNVAEEYRDKYNLPDDYSPMQIFNAVNERAEKLGQKLFEQQKEVEKNAAQKNEQESK